MKHWAAGVVAMSIFWTAVAAGMLGGAGEARAAGEKKDPLAWKPPLYIQVKAMMLPVGKQTAPVSLVIQSVKRDKTESICKRLPKVRDAVMRALYRKPIPVRGRKMMLKGLDKRLLKPMNRAVGKNKNYIKQVFITPGAVRMGAAKVKFRPHAVIDGCENIMRSEREREQAMKAAQEK